MLGGIPTVGLDYSPLWDVNLSRWTDDAIAKNLRSRLTGEFQILEFARKGLLTKPDGSPFGSSRLIVNCPIVMRFL